MAIRFTRESEAMIFFRIGDDDVAKIADALGTTVAGLADGRSDVVEAWASFTAGVGEHEFESKLGITATPYAQWIPGGDFGYFYEFDAEGRGQHVFGEGERNSSS